MAGKLKAKDKAEVAANSVTEADKKVVADKAAAKADKEGKLIPVIKSGALSVDLGPMIIGGMYEAYKKEEQANQLIAEIESKRFDLLAKLTNGIVKAAKADASINLAVAFEGDKKKMAYLNDQLGLALGFREVTEVAGKGDKPATKSIGFAKSVAKFMPDSTKPKTDPENIRRNTVRSNFVHMLKKCAMAASGIVAQNLTVKTDTKTGTLQISGPAVMEKFGQESVLLNDKLTVGEGDKAKKLKEKPSFTALGRIGAAAAGKELTVRKDSRSIIAGAVDPDTAIQSLCASLISGIGKMKDKPIPKTVESLKSAQLAIANLLK